MSRQQPHNIMVADDDPAILEVVTMVLEDEGYKVTASTDGQAVVELEEELPNLILLDIWMSGINGRDVVKVLKSKPHTKTVPVILFSANRDCEAIALEVGADDYLLKPFDIEELLNKVKQHAR